MEEGGVFLLHGVVGDDDGVLVVVRDGGEQRPGRTGTRAERDFGVVRDEPIDGRRADVVEGLRVGDGASDEVDGRRGFHSESSVGERDRAMPDEWLEETLVLVVPAGLVEEAEDGGIVPIPVQWDPVGREGNEHVVVDGG